MVRPEEVELHALVVLTADLAERRRWLGKLARLVDLVEPAERSKGLLDGVIADLFGIPAALQDILGDHKNLAAALCAMADLYEGQFSTGGELERQLSVLAPRIADGRLEETRQALMDRLLRQLASVQPLDRHDTSRERVALGEVIGRLSRPDGLLGGPAAADGLTRRYALLLEEGGRTALTKAVSGVASMMADSLFRVVYLLQLAESKLGPDLSSEILRVLIQEVRVSHIDDLAPEAWPAEDRLRLVTRIYARIDSCTVVPEEEKVALLTGLDSLLVDYLEHEQVVQGLDDANLSLYARATRLLEFCAGGVLPPMSQALALAREHVVRLLRQPNFELRLVDGVGDAPRRETMLRELHALMARGGFH
jgi:hypothetical protein